MSVDAIVGAIVGLLGGNGILAWIRYRHDKRAGISSDERVARRDKAEDRRDTIADRDGLIARLETRLEKVETRLTLVEDDNAAKATTIRRQVEHIDALHDHVDVLEDWIWKGKEPPPPQRPVRAS